jgi:hypothetical protein
MISRYRSLPYLASLTLAAVLAACSSTPTGNFRKDAAHEQLLQSLRQCLVELPISGERNKDFVSPCVEQDVSSLNGISRHRLVDALGPPRLCRSQTEINFPDKNDCPSDQDPVWSFYRHADSIDMSGGPELVCAANRQNTCVTVEWRRTK